VSSVPGALHTAKLSCHPSQLLLLLRAIANGILQVNDFISLFTFFFTVEIISYEILMREAVQRILPDTLNTRIQKLQF
jgi:hypothetical protein